MDNNHMLLGLGLIITFALALWVRKGIVWGMPLAYSVLLAYKAITQLWEVFIFPIILGIFIISIMGFIKGMIEEPW